MASTEIPRPVLALAFTESDARPDMWGYDESGPRVLLENKFWAGLTEQQPVGYLRLLANYGQPSTLLVVVPETRLEIIWRELARRLSQSEMSLSSCTVPAGFFRLARTTEGPFLALTS